ncbi:MAG TPA: 2OG-Fe(II) oxygenase [Pirellulaceae bacterium]|nr:2OG-Fe(II) oxygenase [Pirellulaceae bacterium]
MATAKKLLNYGEPAPWFAAPCTTNPNFHFDTIAGRYVVLCFFGSAAAEPARTILADILRRREVFDDEQVCFFGVTADPDDEKLSRVRESLPGVRFFWDFDGAVSRLYGAAPSDPPTTDLSFYRRVTYVLDERLRTIAAIPFQDDPASHASRLLELLDNLPPLAPPARACVQAPVLVVPRIFEPALCRRLIDFYDERGGRESGFMREVDGRTVEVHDYGHKRRRDQEITDEPLRNEAMFRIHDRLIPEIYKAFQFRVTRIERHMVACYESETSGHFRAHRDNTTKGTAHRRFAVSLNLNTGEYEGGLLRFPEFSRHLYQPPAGGAVVFSCSLLHEATPVTAGKRYAYLPFLYDDAAAKIREANQKFVGAAAGQFAS